LNIEGVSTGQNEVNDKAKTKGANSLLALFGIMRCWDTNECTAHIAGLTARDRMICVYVGLLIKRCTSITMIDETAFS
jgi:hypothetical protein